MALASRRLHESPLCDLLFAGDYTELLKRTVDSRSGAHSPEDTPFVVGALAFSGRQDEAIAAFRWWMNEHGTDPTIHVACRFFLVIGECRTGRYGQAIAHARATVSTGSRGDALHAFFAHQALGLLRYFTGRARSASRHAAAARRAALEARFSYGRMLALDLLGQALVLQGQVHAGISVLEQSAELAEALGLVANAGAPRAAVGATCAQYAVAGFDGRGELARLAATARTEDSYSRRVLLSELAMHQAFAGDGAKARISLEAAARIALPDGDRRAKIRLVVAQAVVTAFARGPEAARESLDRARALLDPILDDGLDVEVSWANALVCGSLKPSSSGERDRLATLARRTRIARASILAFAGEPLRVRELLAEDRVAELLRLIDEDPDAARHRVVSNALWGWLPRLSGVPPGRRIYLLHGESLIVVEDHGVLTPLEMPGAILVKLLEAIATRPMQKDELLFNVWAVRVYRAERHDSLVHTTISRLRTALGVAGSWIRATEAGYGIADGVSLVHLGGELDAKPFVAESVLPRQETGAEVRQKAADDRRARVLRLLARAPLSTSEVAAELKISEMTAFRLLSTMAKEGTVERTGQGKRTRYCIPP